VLEYPDSRLHEAAGELRREASSLLNSLATKLRQPRLDVRDSLADLNDGVLGLLSRTVATGENPENEVTFMLGNAKQSLALLLDYYANEVKDGNNLKKLQTHAPLAGIAQATVEGVSASS